MSFNQASNPYIVKLSILDDELALNVSLTNLIHVYVSLNSLYMYQFGTWVIVKLFCRTVP